MKTSKTEAIRKHLEKGHYITGIIAMQQYGLYRLSSVINRLRNRGMDIRTEMVTGRNGDTFAKYTVNR